MCNIRVSDLTCITDVEQRILLSMIERERKACREVDGNGEPVLSKIVDSLEQKIRKAFEALEKESNAAQKRKE